MGNVADRPAWFANAADDHTGGLETSAIAMETNAKFSMSDGASEAEFGVLDDFFEGATTRIGYPNPEFLEGMEKEHCTRNNSLDYFQTPNYRVTTCPHIEWQWVCDPNLNATWDTYPGEIGDSVVELSTSLEFESLELRDLRFLDLPFQTALKKNLFCSCFGEISDIFWDPELLNLSISFKYNVIIDVIVKNKTFDRILEFALVSTLNSGRFGFEVNFVGCEEQETDGVDLQRERKIKFGIRPSGFKGHKEKPCENFPFSL
jgi:hypothetical protein